MHAINFNSITHSYSDKTILHNLTFGIEENQITVILGKSGSGKSTILQMINGMIHPSSGYISLFDQHLDYNHLSKLRLGIGYSIQGTSLFPHMTVHKNIALLAEINKLDQRKTEKRIRYLMNFVNMDITFLDKYPYQLSGGEQQRIGICRAMMLNPRIFLLDEAFGALDPSTRSEIHKEILNLQQAEPRTIILVTHDVREAFKLAQRILILDNGEIQQYSDKDEIQSNPANDFVEKFIGSSE